MISTLVIASYLYVTLYNFFMLWQQGRLRGYEIMDEYVLEYVLDGVNGAEMFTPAMRLTVVYGILCLPIINVLYFIVVVADQIQVVRESNE